MSFHPQIMLLSLHKTDDIGHAFWYYIFALVEKIQILEGISFLDAWHVRYQLNVRSLQKEHLNRRENHFLNGFCNNYFLSFQKSIYFD